MARIVFAAVLVSCTALTSGSAYGGFRLDIMGWDPFAQKTTGWTLGLEVFADREEAERQKTIVEKWIVVKTARIVEVDESPQPIQLPPELNPTLAKLDASGHPVSFGDGPPVLLAQFRDLIDSLYLNAQQAKTWALNHPNELNQQSFGKVSAIVEKYNDEIAKANQSPRAPYARVEPLTPQDLLAALTRQMVQSQTEEHERIVKEIGNSLSQLKGERERLLKRQTELDQERNQIAGEETEISKTFDAELSKVQQGLQEIDGILAKNPSRQEVKTQRIEERLKVLQAEKEQIEDDNAANKIKLKAKYDSWKQDYEALAEKFKDFNERSREAKQRLSLQQSKIEKLSEDLVSMQESVQSYFGTDKLESGSSTAISEVIKRFLADSQ